MFDLDVCSAGLVEEARLIMKPVKVTGTVDNSAGLFDFGD
jgi:hypothetical protein